MTILHSIILGIVEGVTEFLPISSTGHLILASDLLGIAETAFTKSFDIIIQLGAILAVVVFYWRTLWKWETIKKLFVAFVPTAVLGILFYKMVKTYLVGNVSVVLWSLCIGGVALILFERFYGKRDGNAPGIADISYRQAFIIGIFQSIAFIPGVSRAAATIVGGLSLGIARATIVEFSFLLAVPTMLAATVLDIYKSHAAFSLSDAGVLALGFAVSFVVAILAIRFLLRFVRGHRFTSFGIYRILLAIVFWIFIL